MIIKPRIRGFICTTSHPTGCAHAVQEQIDWTKEQQGFDGPKNALVIGSSTGYGLASRIALTYGSRSSTIGVFFEKPSDGKRTATAGWYNSVAFRNAARKDGFYAENINGDAFSNQIKDMTIETIKKDLGQVDLVVYSLASPRRTHPDTGENFSAVLKPIGQPYTGKTVNVQTGVVSEVTMETATDEEIDSTISVMGGEDWEMWISALEHAGVLADGAQAIAYTYIGPELTRPMYRDGTIGRAKDHIEATARTLNNRLSGTGGRACISANKAMVTQSSAAIPVVPLYISLLYKVMKEKGIHEGCIEQMYRLMYDRLYSGNPLELDDQDRIRIDDYEMTEEIQSVIHEQWNVVTSENLESLTDIEGYRLEFLKLFGFGIPGIDYDADVEADIG
jgi:enoyl-[acyl-carrier protein] reductase/trans-2-enoyl-CoA reductase (NAD+)